MSGKKNQEITEAVLERLPLYYRTIKQFEDRGFKNISSQQLAGFLDMKPEQIRKDLSICGKFGVRSVGYDVTNLKNNLAKVLGLDHHLNLGIVGAGYLGISLAKSKEITELGFNIVALFDNDSRIIGSEVGSVKVYDFAKFKSISQRKMIDIGVIAVPKKSAPKVADTLIAAGVKGIWNFAPVKLLLPNNFPVVNVDFSFDLSILNYYITRAGKNSA